jgi:hypothetical protein
MKNVPSVATGKSPGMVGVLAVLAALVAPCAASDLLPDGKLYRPGEGLPDPSYSSAAEPGFFTTGNTLAVYTSAYTQNPIAPGITGTVTSTVYKDPSNGDLGFSYSFTMSGGNDIQRATIGDETQPWNNVTISDAGSFGTGSSTATGNAPDWADGYPIFLSRDPGNLGESVAIQFNEISAGTYLYQGGYSANVYFVTNATSSVLATVALSGDGGAQSTALAYAPAPVSVPEPSTLILLVGGLGGMGLVRLVRRSRQEGPTAGKNECATAS